MAFAHRNLVAWRRADDLFIEVHVLTRQRFPEYERYELGRQVRRSAFSVPANIVEGFARSSNVEKIRFFNIASASLNELEYALHAARRLGYLTFAEFDQLTQKVRSVSAPLQGLIKSHRTKIAAARGATVVFVILAMARLA
jgi:four helix bundle protein